MTETGQGLGLSTDVDALVNLAQREHRAGRLDEAIAAYRRILAIRPDVAQAYNGLGGALLAQGHLDLAAAHFERAVAFEPGLFEAHHDLGNILWQQGKVDEAIARYQQAIALRPDFAEAYNNLGNVMRAQGKLDEAAAQCSRAAVLRPRPLRGTPQPGLPPLPAGPCRRGRGELPSGVGHQPAFRHHML